MLNKINLDDPITYSVIGFVIIFIYQYYNKRVKNPKDIDDYTNDDDIISLLKVPLLTGFLIWLACNYLSEANKSKSVSNLGSLNQVKATSSIPSIPSIPSTKPVVEVSKPSNIINNNKNIALRDIFTEQPNF
ncbi:hypothetical protein CPAV1605_597 [seawater metagenome]|uniref:Uncharacterized protein n=1 Tax=seawater metagenome TaxID=1561972 RepID=A0A5E8CLR0_9ZZZZ